MSDGEQVARFLRLVAGMGKPCKGAHCGATVFWVTTVGGKPMPFDADLTPHWATCPDAESFRKPKAAPP